MIVLGLDPSLTSFGWCVHNSSVGGSGRVIAKGTYSTKSEEAFVRRNMFMRESVRNVIREYPHIEAAGVESPDFNDLWSEGMYGLFLYVNEALLHERKDVVFFAPPVVKMLTKMDPSIRRGTMDKQDMITAAKVDTGIKQWKHDEADAYHVARHAARFWDRYFERLTDDELTPAELHSFTRIHVFKRGIRAGRVDKRGLVFRENDRFFRYSQLEAQDGSA